MSAPDIPPSLLARFERAAKELAQQVTWIAPSTYDEDLRQWLDGKDEPVNWQNPSGVTPDEYFFVTTLYGNMNLEGQRTMIRKFFGPLFVQGAKRDVRNFLPEMAGYAGLRSTWMKDRLCTMGRILRDRGISLGQYVEELRALEKDATAENPTPALDKIIRDHAASGVKTLSVFVRDCVGGNCFPIDLRVRRQLEKHKLPEDERMLVRMSLALGQDPRQLARIFYEAEPEETSAVDFVNLDESEPCVFYIWEGKGWMREPSRKPARQQNAFSFDVFDSDTERWERCTMSLEKDGLYHWHDLDGQGHWWGAVSETDSHTYLFGNYINPDGHQGVQIFIWPKSQEPLA